MQFEPLSQLAVLVVSLALTSPRGDVALDKLLKEARGTDSVARLAAYDALTQRGDEGKKLLLPILRAAEDRAARDLLALPRSSDAQSYKRWLVKEIETSRAAALAIIRDTKLYPDDAHGAIGQPKVDDAVARLRELWNRPSRFFAEKVEAVNIRLYYVKEASDWLKKVGAVPNRFTSKDDALAELDAVFEVRRLVYDKGETTRFDEIYDDNATGASAATDEERRFARILNDYRVMLGLQPLRLTDPLVIASRKHSQEMLDLNYFAHESPVEANRSPQDRARREGHGGSVLENCAISGDAQDAFDGWYTSSGHHRGLISSSAQVLGAGQSILPNGHRGRHWTMMAGGGSPAKAKGSKSDPREVFASRRAKLGEKDVETRLALAKYCEKHELVDEQRQLFQEVVKIDPENKVAHLALGDVRHEGKWVTPEEKFAAELASRPREEVIAEAGARLDDPDSTVRFTAVRALASSGDAKAVPFLARALGDKASEVRMTAAAALGSAKAKEAIPALERALGDSSFYVANAAALALVRMDNVAGIPTLFQSLRSPDLSHRIDAHKQARSAFGQDFGYAWDLPETERAKVVDEWEAWVKERFPAGK